MRPGMEAVPFSNESCIIGFCPLIIEEHVVTPTSLPRDGCIEVAAAVVVEVDVAPLCW